MKIIAHIETDFKSKFGVPRQSGLVPDVVGKIVFEDEFAVAEAINGLEEFSHLWLIWEFSEHKGCKWQPTVRPPVLGGNKRKGVFATRSPFRPNPVGISVVEILKTECEKGRPFIYVKGADLMDGTPIYDIKPYLPYVDSIENAKGGFTEYAKKEELSLELGDLFFKVVKEDKQNEIKAILASDPRPAYHDDPDRIYKFEYGEYFIAFRVEGKTLYLKEIKQG